MKKALLLAALVSVVTQSTLIAPALAGPERLLMGAKMAGAGLGKVVRGTENAAKAAGAATWRGVNKIADPKFPTGLTIAIPMSIFGIIALDQLKNGLCALEATIASKGKILTDEQCRLYYGDPRINSCMASNDNVVLMFPTDEGGKSAVQFVGQFDRGNQLLHISFGAGTLDENKKFNYSDFPAVANMNQSGQAVEFALAPGQATRRGMKEDDDEMFAFFDKVAAVMRMAYTECSPGKYDAMMKKVLEVHTASQGQKK